MSKVFLSVMFSCFLSAAIGQGKGQLAGSLRDSSGKKPIAYATVTVFTAADTSIVTYRLSDEGGKFSVPGLPLNVSLRAVITATGFEVWRKEFTLTPDTPQLDIGQQKMMIAITEMDEVLVVSERPPVVVRRDTIEFNASAFKTLPTALVEDLLKKFPGVEVDREGNITVNGRKVNRMLVDGKEFFGNDPKVASRNLPANLIDKVQVTDDKEELQRNPDLAAGDIGQVINLKLKKSIKQGWFGKLYAGGGTNSRYETGGIVNLFRDTLQISLLGYSNNLTRSGFGIQDIMNIGGFGRSSINSMMVSSTGGFALNGISFGGLGQGIQRSSGGGLNVNHVLNKNTTLSVQYFYGATRTETGQRGRIQQFFNDTTLLQNSTATGLSNDFSHRISAYLKSNLDSLSTLQYRPSFVLSKVNGSNTAITKSDNNYDGALNESNNAENFKNRGFSMTHDLSYNRNFTKKGRTLFASLLFSINTADRDQYNEAANIFYKTGSTTALQQLRNQDQQNWNGRLNAVYNEPLSDKWSLRFTQALEMFGNEEAITTLDYDPLSGEFVIPNETFTNGLTRDGFRSSTFTGFNYRYKKITITPGVTFRALSINNHFQKDPSLKQSFFFALPALTLRLDKWNLSYSVSANEPAVADLQPTVNNTNPLFIQTGNSSLNPTLSHNIGVNAFANNIKKSLTYNFYINGTISKDAVVRERIINEDGVQLTRPVNVNGVWQVSMSNGIRKQYKFSQKWKASIGANLYGAYNRSLVLLNTNKSNTHNFTINPSLNWSFNWDDKVELIQRYGPSWSKSSYDDPVYRGLEFWRHGASTELIVRLPKRIVWESSLDYNYNPQVVAGMQKSVFLWNAAVNLLFFKQDKGQLKLSVYDLLNQNRSVYRTINENYIRDTESLLLRRYYLLTFTYNIRNFGAKVGGRNSFMFF